MVQSCTPCAKENKSVIDIFWLSNYVKPDCPCVLFVMVCGRAKHWPAWGKCKSSANCMANWSGSCFIDMYILFENVHFSIDIAHVTQQESILQLHFSCNDPKLKSTFTSGVIECFLMTVGSGISHLRLPLGQSIIFIAFSVGPCNGSLFSQRLIYSTGCEPIPWVQKPTSPNVIYLTALWSTGCTTLYKGKNRQHREGEETK